MAVERLPFEIAKPSPDTFVTETSEIGHNGQPLDEVLEGLDNISKESTQSEEDAIIYETDGGVLVGKIDANGADFTNLKRGGQQVARMSDLPTVPTLDTSIGSSPSNSHTPSTKAVKDYVDAHGGGEDYPIEKEQTQNDDTNVFIENSNGEKIVEVTETQALFKNLSLNAGVVLEVASDGTRKFSTINAALTYAKTIESANNPVTILIYPGVYKEVVKGGAYISFIGVNKHDCIIRNDDGIYGHTPLYYDGVGIIANLTIISTHDEYTYHEGDNVDNIKAYAIHADNQDANQRSEGILEINNCILISKQAAAIGIGTRENHEVRIVNCQCLSDMPSWSVRSYSGAILAHSYAYADNQNQKLTLIGNTCISTGSNGGLTIFNNSQYAGLDALLVNNLFYQKDVGHKVSIGGTNNTINNASYGNSVASTNKN